MVETSYYGLDSASEAVSYLSVNDLTGTGVVCERMSIICECQQNAA